MGADIEILRAEARRVVACGLAASAAGSATARALATSPPDVPAQGGRRLIVAVGCFAREMAVEARAALGPCETLVVTDPPRAAPMEGARVLPAGWPDPDPAGLRAAEAVEDAVARIGSDDTVLLLLSKGAARMLPAPVAGITLADLAAVERLMREAGAGADEALLVRQQLSRLEGGGLAARLAARGAAALAIAIADAGDEGVAGANSRRLAGGMLAPPLGSRITARALLELYGLWARVPVAVRARLSGPSGEEASRPRLRLRIVASNALAVSAMAGDAVRAMARPLQGGAVEIAHDLLAIAAGLAPGTGCAFGLEPDPTGAALAAWDDESMSRGTDRSAGHAGDGVLVLRAPIVAGMAGPRHSDLALRFALLARDRRLAGPWVLLLTATDGGTADHVPGVMVDSETLARLHAGGIDPDEARDRGRAAEVLDRIDAALRSGPTGTDVGDISVFLRG